MKILLLGNSAREHIIAETLCKNKSVRLFSYIKAKNPGIISLSKEFETGEYGDMKKIRIFAEKIKPDFAFIGPEEPLSKGVVDLLKASGIKSVGPAKKLARLESSKSFTRKLMEKYKIEGNPIFKIFDAKNVPEAKNFIDGLEMCVIKPDGLTGGKGVKVQGDHFETKKEAFDYCNEVLRTHPYVIVEEKFDGEEFSLMCFTDGKTVVAMPPVQDHKRAFVDDKGPNTGGMGSYSCENHLLPFLTEKDVKQGLEITKKVANALLKETGEYYRGIMYAGLIATKNGVKVVEYNARFGDPEAMNVLAVLETDLAEILQAIVNQALDKVKIKFAKKATVCKYVVPQGYPDNPAKNEKVEIGKIPKGARIYYASVDKKDDGLYLSSSRGIACVGIAESLEKAEILAEEAAKAVRGKVFHREDIGTKKLIQKKISHMQDVVKTI